MPPPHEFGKFPVHLARMKFERDGAELACEPTNMAEALGPHIAAAIFAGRSDPFIRSCWIVTMKRTEIKPEGFALVTISQRTISAAACFYTGKPSHDPPGGEGAGAACTAGDAGGGAGGDEEAGGGGAGEANEAEDE